MCVEGYDDTDRWPLPFRSFAKLENLIVNDPIQPVDGVQESLTEGRLVVTKHTTNLMQDISCAMIASVRGAVLVVCSESGTGKTATAISAVVATHEIMANNFLIAYRIPTGLSSDQWFQAIARTFGLPQDNPMRAADELIDALCCTYLRTKKPAWLKLVGDRSPAVNEQLGDKPILVLEDYNPREFKGVKDDVAVLELRKLLWKSNGYIFLNILLHRACGSNIVVIITTESNKSLRVLTAINGGQTVFMAGCTTKDYVGDCFYSLEHGIPTLDDHRGLVWSAAIQEERFTPRCRRNIEASVSFQNKPRSICHDKDMNKRRTVDIDTLNRFVRQNCLPIWPIWTRKKLDLSERDSLWLGDTYRHIFCGFLTSDQEHSGEPGYVCMT